MAIFGIYVSFQRGIHFGINQILIYVTLVDLLGVIRLYKFKGIKQAAYLW